MRALVLWADNLSSNLGVRVLAEGTAEIARRAWGPSLEIEFQDFEAHESPVAFDAKGVLCDLGRKFGPIKEKLRRYDLILDTGAGDSFTDSYGPKRVGIMAYARYEMRRQRVPLIFTPQTIGPFNTKYGRYLARRDLAYARLISTRERRSADYAASLGFPATTVTTDVVFALPAPVVVKSRDILLNVSGLLWSPGRHVDHISYRAQIDLLIRQLLSQGRRVSLLAHVLDSANADNDVPAITELATTFGDDVEVVIPRDLEAARLATGSARLVIGSRMHACLNAISMGTPALPWAYSRKFAPLLADLGWPHCVDLRTENDAAAATLKFIATKDVLALDRLVEAVADRARLTLAGTVESLRGLADLPSLSQRPRG